MAVIVSPTESDIQSALRAFCLSVLPLGIDVIAGQVNRVPEPTAGNFVTMTPLRRNRLATNIHVKQDCSFTAVLLGASMTVSALGPNNEVPIQVGAVISGPGVPAALITAQTGGIPGGVGTYAISPNQVASGTFAAGQLSVIEMVEVAIQLGFHSADNTSADNAQAVRQMLRDPYAVSFIQGVNPAITPLFGADARQSPFTDAEDQFESRWTVDAVLQANVTLTNIPQQFVVNFALGLVDVDVVYPP